MSHDAYNLRQRFAAALEARGEQLVEKRSTAHVWTRNRYRDKTGALLPCLRKGQHYYLGPAGSARSGYSLSSSLPLTKAFKQRLLAECDAALKKETTT